jgi:hypothetical protein
VLLLTMLACALGLAACGGDDDVDVQQVLRETFGGKKGIKSGRLDAGLRLDLSGLAQLRGPVRFSLSGPFETAGRDAVPKFDFDAKVDAGGDTFTAGAVSTGDKGFIEIQGQTVAIPDEQFQRYRELLAQDASAGDEGGVSFKSLGIDPQRWLRSPEYAGKEEVGGAETIHIRAGIDVERLLDDVNRVLARAEQVEGDRARQLTEEERRQLGEAIENARLELWTGEEDRILRRINVKLGFELPESARQRANGLTSGTISFDLAFGAINEEQEIRAPENAQPAGGGGGGASEYERCVQQAGSDVSELQKCAALAG